MHDKKENAVNSGVYTYFAFESDKREGLQVVICGETPV